MKAKQKYAFASIVFCLTTLTAQGGFHYQFAPAGSFPGSTYTVPLNISLSHIVGYYVTPFVNHAYIQTGESFADATPYGALVSYLSGINRHGVAVGGYCPQGCNEYVGQYGYTYDFRTGEIQTIHYPMADAATTAYGINDFGMIVGGYCPNAVVCPQGAFSPASDGFIDANGVFTTLNYPGAQATSALAINNRSTVVGEYDINNTGPHSFLYQNGTFTNIDYPGSNYTVASGINNSEVVAGFFATASGALHGFIYYKGTFTQVDRPDSPNGSGASGINDHNDLVGTWTPSIGFAKPYKAVPIGSHERP